MKRVNVRTMGRAVARATAKPPLPLTKKQREVLGSVLRELGRMGGKASAAKLTAKQRSEKARKAGLAGGRGRAKKGGRR